MCPLKMRVETCAKTNQLLGFIDGIAGAHTCANDLTELRANICDVLWLVFDEQQFIYNAAEDIFLLAED